MKDKHKPLVRRGMILFAGMPLMLGMTAATLSTANASSNASTAKASATDKKPIRWVITTDGEGDDQASMHRALLYANDVDIAAIVSTASKYHWAGDPTANPPIATRSWSGTTWVPKLIGEGYRAVYPNLVVHDSRYPTPEQLLSVYKNGNITNVGEMATDTEGSLLVKSILLDNDPRPVSLQAWGGTNTIAAALRSIEDQYKNTPRWASIYKKVTEKAQAYLIQDQDSTYKDYIAVHWPKLPVVVNKDQFEAFAYRWAGNPAPQIDVFRKPFLDAHLSAGPYMASYPRANGTSGDWFSEGDSPSFLHAVPNGLDGFTNPAYGGWGGRFVQINDNLFVDAPRYLNLSPEINAMDIANDSSLVGPVKPNGGLVNVQLAAAAARGDTTLTLNTNRANGAPGANYNMFFVGNVVTVGVGSTAEVRTIVGAQMEAAPFTITLNQPLSAAHAANDYVVNQSSTRWPQGRWNVAIQMDFAARAAWTVTPKYRSANHSPRASVSTTAVSAKRGQKVPLNASAKDPDGNNLKYTWWNYVEAGTYKGGEVSIANSTDKNASIIVPADAKPGDKIHVILEVSDDAPITMTSYARVVVTVK
ncbi:nucleoside hydrolase-like domain-containing protein [Dactylosporangium sp. CA-233914]|uniref:DUF1593 domain-containing protein n=1 Tax=Dactylosporangium sp. CA-233914 TaxID=3239934 RepID=UPI003D8ADB43